MADSLRVEFHCHTEYSPDSLTRPADLLAACRRKGIDRVVITDHNTIAGAQRARDLDPQRVIVGEEIMTQRGELLAAYVAEEIPAGLPPLEAIERLHAQGAFISVSHPFDKLRSGHWELPDLLEITPLVDAVEVFNARCFPPWFNARAQKYAQVHSLLGTVGSDAHAAFEVGRTVMLLPAFEDASGLKRALASAQYETHLTPPWLRLTSRYAYFRKRGRQA